MAKKCLREGEKSAPFLRQKPAKNALFSSISQEKVVQNDLAKCHRFPCFHEQYVILPFLMQALVKSGIVYCPPHAHFIFLLF